VSRVVLTAVGGDLDDTSHWTAGPRDRGDADQRRRSAFETDFPAYLNLLLAVLPRSSRRKELRAKFATVGIGPNYRDFRNVAF